MSGDEAAEERVTVYYCYCYLLLPGAFMHVYSCTAPPQGGSVDDTW